MKDEYRQLSAFFGDDYKKVLTLVEQYSYLKGWHALLESNIDDLPESHGYRYVRAVKDILYDVKTSYIKAFYRQISHEIVNSILLSIVNNEPNKIVTQDQAMHFLQSNIAACAKEINAREAGLAKYGYLAGISSSLTRLWTNTRYYAFGSLAYDASNELFDNVIANTKYGANIGDGIDDFEDSLLHMPLGNSVSKHLQYIDLLLSKLDPKAVVALFLLGVDQFAVQRFGSADFMLTHSLAASFFSDLDMIIRLGNKCNISTKTIVKRVEPICKSAVDLGVFMGIVFGKQLLKSNTGISKNMIAFVLGVYILSKAVQNWAGRIFNRAASTFTSEEKLAPSFFKMVEFVLQFIVGLGVSYIANKVMQPLFFKPGLSAKPSSSVALVKTFPAGELVKLKRAALKVLGIQEGLSYREIIRHANEAIFATHQDRTHGNSSAEFNKVYAARLELKELFKTNPEIFIGAQESQCSVINNSCMP
ncbi:MAG: hypothetical protein KAS93_07270 [Gammaproteobacteria bacterium]|nr:hypothetical protein [Gammaproteobacteria bacterium]